MSVRQLNVISTTIINPYVHLLGENSACIAYTRTTNFRAGFVDYFLARFSTFALIGRLHGAIVAATGRSDDRCDRLRRRSPRLYTM